MVTVMEIGPGDTARAFDAMVALRPHHDDREAFVARVDVQRQQGYRLLGASVDTGDALDGVLGFRPVSCLAWGDALYVDDLSVLPAARRRGVASALLDAVVDVARHLGCVAVHLDSGHQRHDAHKLYLRHGFEITSHHFALAL